MHKPARIATRATEGSFGHLQTHEAGANKVQSDDELEWNMEDIDIECSDTEEVDDMVPILNEVDEH